MRPRRSNQESGNGAGAFLFLDKGGEEDGGVETPPHGESVETPPHEEDYSPTLSTVTPVCLPAM